MSRTTRQTTDEWIGMALGLLATAIFSITLPSMRIAVAEMPPVMVGVGRSVVAALFAMVFLALARARRPDRRDLGALVLVAAGVVVGFPYFTALAMRSVPAAHGGVMLAILPLVTALFGTVIQRERPSAGFWAFAVAGSGTVVVFALVNGGGALQLADLYLVLAMLSAALGYSLGARLALRLGGWQVICWALIVALPVTLPPTLWVLPSLDAGAISGAAWAAFFYIALLSQLIGFFPWYRGLTLGGVARVSQTQLVMPFLTLAAAAVLVGENIDTTTIGFAVMVVAIVAFGRRMPVHREANR